MVDVIQIPNLPAATSLDGTELIEVVQGGVSCRATSAQIAGLYGSGSTITQSPNKSSTVVLSEQTGQITTAADALLADATVSFTLTNTTIGANDVPIITRKSGGTALASRVWVDSVAAGSCVICLKNESGGPLSEAVLLQFTIVRGAIS